jgi:hypothetical protein
MMNETKPLNATHVIQTECDVCTGTPSPFNGIPVFDLADASEGVMGADTTIVFLCTFEEFAERIACSVEYVRENYSARTEDGSVNEDFAVYGDRPLCPAYYADMIEVPS